MYRKLKAHEGKKDDLVFQSNVANAEKRQESHENIPASPSASLSFLKLKIRSRAAEGFPTPVTQPA